VFENESLPVESVARNVIELGAGDSGECEGEGIEERKRPALGDGIIKGRPTIYMMVDRGTAFYT
jgi:hypothetical protein